MDQEPVVIIGAGPAGIAAAVSLAELGVRSVIIDREGQVASSWRGRYDRLKLDTNKWFSRLPGRPYPKGTPIFPTRDQVADYFERHAQIDGVVHRLNTGVERVEPLGDGGWQLQTSGWEHRGASRGGRDRSGEHTRYSGVARFEHLHGRIAALVGIPQLRCPTSGSGSWWSARGRREWISLTIWQRAGRPRCGWPCARRQTSCCAACPVAFPAIFSSVRCFSLSPSVADTILRFLRLVRLGDLSEFGLPIPEEGAFAAAHRRAISPSIIDMDVIKAIRRNEIEMVQTVASVDTAGVSLVDGTLVQPEVVIAATGYRPGLESMVGHLDVLDDHGVPQIMAPKPASKGLWFIGYQLGPSLLGIAGQQSRPLARMIANDLGAQPKTKDPLAPTVETEGTKW